MKNISLVFWKRMTVDLLVFGPSLNYMISSGKMSGDLDEDEIQAIDKELVQKIIDKFPVPGEVFSNENLSFSNDKAKFGTGFRYSVQIGFHF